jgi:glycosyltransferase involved in cell wall biosynthesis
MKQYQFGFILEQALGHITHTKNLQATVEQDAAVRAYWGLIPFGTDGIAKSIPVFRSNWTIRAGVRARRAVMELTKAAALDALFFHTQVPAILSTDQLKRVPSVVSLDATPLQYDALGTVYGHQRGAAWLERTKWRLNRDCFRAARHLITWSEWARQSLIHDYDVSPEKITVIPPGVHVREWLRPVSRTRTDAPVKILFVGGDFARKGGLLLLKSFRTLRSLGVELHVVTRDALSPEPGLFLYQNMQPNSPALKALYHQADIFCLPTYGDCLPMVLSEAGAAGLPVVSTHVAAIPEIVHDNKTGALIPIGDVEALTAALRKLVSDPAMRLRQGAQAIDTVSKQFDASQNTQRLLSVLKQVA